MDWQTWVVLLLAAVAVVAFGRDRLSVQLLADTMAGLGKLRHEHEALKARVERGYEPDYEYDDETPY